MIAVVDDDDLVRRREAGTDPLERFQGAEGIAGSLHEEHRRFEGIQVPVAQLVGPSGRMKRIAEEHEPGDGIAGRGKV
jgi:hypothetical protein